MKKEDFAKMIQDIGTCTDDAERRKLLANLQEEASKDYDEISRLTESVTTLQSKNNKLMETNLDLFMKVGLKTTPEKDGPKPEQKEQVRKYEDLFNEKGELK